MILGAQAHDDDLGGKADPGEEGVRNQYDQYYAANIPVWWYSWTSTITDIKRNYQYLMNEFYRVWAFFENKGANATQSSLKQFSIGDYVKWKVRAYNAVGVSDWSISGDVYIGTTGEETKKWTTKADFESGSLSGVWIPEGLNRLELKRTALSGTGTWVFDSGTKKCEWLSFTSTKPNQNIYFRDDFRDNSLEAWTIIAGTWTGYNHTLRGTASLGWGSNRIIVGSTSWQGLDILFKGYKAGGDPDDPDHRFYLRATTGINMAAYGWLLSSGDTVSAIRVDTGEILDLIEKGVSSPSKDVWYWFRLQIYTSGGDVIQKLKWWPVGSGEPGGWNVTHTWSGEEWRSEGCFSIGRHSTGGENRYDNFLFSRKEGIPSPPNCSVSYKFWASDNGTAWGSQYTDINQVPISRFIKIQATLSRTSLLSAMPTIEDMTLEYRSLKVQQPIFIF
ncbi:hypothetical protein ES703_115018 [subsurface metagenome]